MEETKVLLMLGRYNVQLGTIDGFGSISVTRSKGTVGIPMLYNKFINCC